MSEALDRLAAMAGIEASFIALTGETVVADDEAKRATLRAMGVAADDDAAIAAGIAAIHPVGRDGMQAPAGVACFLPDWLREGRCWGIACQLYGLRSTRNWGIGDFQDLARIAEIAAAAGADFVGINPLHALFTAAPEHCSPFSPSNRRFLNPLYIAIDKAPFHARMKDALQPPDDIRSGDLVDYARVGAIKIKALTFLFRIFQARAGKRDRKAFEEFVVRGGQALYLHALFEALSATMTETGHGAGWHGWPEDYRHPGTDAVRAFAEEHTEDVTFHTWLQWLADRQLGEAQARARAASMRIGLYLDFAVGEAADGSAAWSDPTIVVSSASIGAPPDYFNAAGQNWGLAPLSPAGLAARDFKPLREALRAALGHAGALRIDHAMSLYRLFWIASGLETSDGVYVRYPFHDMLRVLAEVSQACRALLIGEDLGVVPPGFREVMRAVEIQSYRVFFFEKREDHFLPPDAYPREALACISTHDLYTLAGWWQGHNIDVREAIGMLSDADAGTHRRELAHERRRLLGLLDQHGLLPPDMAAVMRDEAPAPARIPEDVVLAVHRLVARTPSRLFAVQVEELVGAVDQVNIPGTTAEHPNWRRRLPFDIEALPAQPLFSAVSATLREERPKPQ